MPQIFADKGQSALTGGDLFHPDIRGALAADKFADFSIGETSQQRTTWFYDCATSDCIDFVGFAIEARSYGTPLRPAQLRSARRPAAAGQPERLVILGEATRGGTRPVGKVLVWDHEAQIARVVATIPAGFHSLAAQVTRQRAIVSNDAPSGTTPGDGTYLIDLDTPSGSASKTAFFPLTDLVFGGFTLLEPDHLYNLSAMKFYRSAPPLAATRLPASLAPVPGNPTGSYHIFNVR